jgi:hypothetical protein
MHQWQPAYLRRSGDDERRRTDAVSHVYTGNNGPYPALLIRSRLATQSLSRAAVGDQLMPSAY